MIERGPPAVPFDLRTHGFDQAVVADSGRASSDARHAAEARVEVPLVRVVPGRTPFEARLHEVNAPARRVRLAPPDRIRRTGGQAEPAVDAVLNELRGGRMNRIEDAGHASSYCRRL